MIEDLKQVRDALAAYNASSAVKHPLIREHGISALAALDRIIAGDVGVPVGVPDCAEVYVGNGKYAICDWGDWEKIKSFNWRLTTKNKSGCLYAHAWSSEDAKTRKRISMHGLIMDGNLIDHINGNGLDNRRINLRHVTHQQNAFNQKNHGGSSKYKGVSFDKESGLWRAYITFNGKRKYLGRHGSEVDAAKVYDMKAKELFGEYAKCNF